eukprot:CAMPEP_0197034636 /NCGR_PEP_ID=MMETSP1384-20130603/12685_1 /TAXON_ID=29189 /ORGANISM="Ammonia sp." /LENGTH=991 /DNA_ID=CAMNT_0042464585 /DNA_START=32 /DNA_END=3007 /DNA_ORIENTATION=-
MSLKLKKLKPTALFDTVETAPSAFNYGKQGKYLRVNNSVSMYTSEKSLPIFDEDAPLSPRKDTGTIAEDNDEDTPLSPGQDADDADAEENSKRSQDELDEEDEANKAQPAKFGTLDGVFGRCLLCMWGVIMFLRTGWIVGNAGIWQTTMVMILSASITFFTTLSLSAICTNGEISHGGPYFLISRSLGPQFGGVIGLLFAVGNCVGVALHLVGFAEAIVSLYYPKSVFGGWDIQLIAEIGLLILFGIALRGVGSIIKFNLFLLFLMFVSIIAFFIGTFIPNQAKYAVGFTGYSAKTFKENWGPAYMNDSLNFLTMVAIFFPSVTGCMAGANISGDLKKPSVNIPVGTIAAVAFSMIVYVLIAWMLGACVVRELLDENGDFIRGAGLYHNYVIMSDISLWRPLVDIGIYASTFSSATSCFVAAPRIFKAVCDDGLFPMFAIFAVGRKSDNEPVRCYVLVVIICALIMLSGDINFIAPMVTNFFLLTYALVNYSVFAWDISKSPGWRPSFKYYNKWVSLFATIQAVLLMALIDWIMALVTGIIGLICYLYIGHRDVEVNWGTTVESKLYQQGCKIALKYQKMNTEHAKITRPTFLILLYENNIQDVNLLYELSQCLNYSEGLIFIGNIILGDLTAPEIAKEYALKRRSYKNYDLSPDILNNSLVETCVSDSYEIGIKHLLQTCGMGSMRPNVFMIKIDEDIETLKISTESLSYSRKQPTWFTSLRYALLTNLGVIMIPDHFTLDMDEEEENADNDEAKEGTIDIWWLFDDGGLTILTGYLLTKHKKYKNYKLRIMALDELGFEDHTEMVYLMNKLRIQAHIEHVKTEPDEMTEMNHRGSIDDMRVHISYDQETDSGGIVTATEEKEMMLDGVDEDVDGNPNDQEEDEEEEFGEDEVGEFMSGSNGVLDSEKKRKTRKISEFAHQKIIKYRRVGRTIEKYSKDAKLCLLTMPYPRAKFKWWEYSHIIHDLTPKNHDQKTLFIRGTQEQVLTFCF